MYLKSVYIENNGPLRKLNLDIQIREDGTPKPLILVDVADGFNFANTLLNQLLQAEATERNIRSIRYQPQAC